MKRGRQTLGRGLEAHQRHASKEDLVSVKANSKGSGPDATNFGVLSDLV